MRATMVFIITICIFISYTGCYKSVPIKPDEEKWWEMEKTWIRTNDYEKWIKVKEVKGDSVYGEMDMGISRPAYKKVVVPLKKVEHVKRMKIDPVLSSFGIAVLGGAVLGVVFIVSLSKATLFE